MSDITNPKPKVPMREATAIVAELCHRIEDGEEPDQAMQAAFQESQLTVAEAIDRRKAVKASLEGQAEAARVMAKGYGEAAKSIDALIESLKKDTLKIMLAFPDQPYRDTAGRKLSIVTGVGKLVVDIDMGQKTVTGIIDANDIHDHKIPLEFIKPVSFYVLDTAALRLAVIEGRELPWARIAPSTFLRGL